MTLYRGLSHSKSKNMAHGVSVLFCDYFFYREKGFLISIGFIPAVCPKVHSPNIYWQGERGRVWREAGFILALRAAVGLSET